MNASRPIRRLDFARAAAAPMPRFPGWRTLYPMQSSRDRIVYRAAPAESPSDAADYVVKTLTPETARRPEHRAAFAREAVAAAAVQHSHVIPVLDGDLHGETPYLVFPFLEGCTLRQALTHRMPLSLPAALWTVRQAAEGLAALHAAGFAHLDVKPDNLHLSPQGHVTVLDLGAARPLGQSAPDFAGDVGYAAPEAWSNPYAADSSADVYSLGMTFYETLVGAPPSAASDVGEWVAFHKLGAVPDLRNVLPNLPVELARLVESMLRKAPLRRPGLAEVRDELTRFEIATFRDRRTLLRPFDPDRPTSPDGDGARKSRPHSERSASTQNLGRVG